MTDSRPPKRPSARVLERPEREPPASLVPPARDDAAQQWELTVALERLAEVLARTRRSIDALIDQIDTADPVPEAPDDEAPAGQARPSRPAPPAALAGHVWSRAAVDGGE